MRRFQVWAHRRGAGWELHIEGVGAATAAKVTQAEAVARESIAAALGVPDDSFAVDVVVCLAPEIEAMIRQAREAARQAAQAQQEAARQARAVVARLHREGLNGREIAYCLGVTPQRVSQLLGGVGRQKAAKPF